MTPEDYMNLPVKRLIVATFGWPGVILGAAGSTGATIAGDEWAAGADEVLKVSITPVAVLAAAAVMIFHSAVLSGRNVRPDEGGAHAAVAIMTMTHLVAAVSYFGVSIAALSLEAQGYAKTSLVVMAFGLLGLVLGSLVISGFRMADFYRSDHARVPEGSGEDDDS
ncbi:hypothetical protein [Candidatus Poriferisocius sp.]|uniref:hypothetical protein n=1 Tax=Candidatus Poriferisocius sp. TaxID=3101276 RepID=UPI003B027BA0